MYGLKPKPGKYKVRVNIVKEVTVFAANDEDAVVDATRQAMESDNQTAIRVESSICSITFPR